MKEKNALFGVKFLKNIIDVYFDTFFVLYFFQVANYEVIPLAKYYLTLYLFIGIGFFMIREAMKKKIKVPYLRIGVSLQALYISLIMLLKDKIIDYIFLVGIVKGIADGFYHFPSNLLTSEKVNNEERQKFNGILTIVNQITAIVIPLILGVALTYFSYIQIGKIVFVLFIVMFVITIFIKNEDFSKEKINLKGFKEVLKKHKKVKNALIIPLLSGLTYSSGVMGLIITLSKINNFKTNLNLGYVDSVCAVLSLVVSTLFALKIKKKSFKWLLSVSGILSFIVMIIFSLVPNKLMLIIYLIMRCSCITLISLISDVIATNMSNCDEIKTDYKAEYYLIRDCIYSVSRCFGYLVLFVICFTIGMNSINYLLIPCGIALIVETIFLTNLVDEY